MLETSHHNHFSAAEAADGSQKKEREREPYGDRRSRFGRATRQA